LQDHGRGSLPRLSFDLGQITGAGFCRLLFSFGRAPYRHYIALTGIFSLIEVYCKHQNPQKEE
jgi:hypothetical protein